MGRAFRRLSLYIFVFAFVPPKVVCNSLPKNWRQALVSIEVENSVKDRILTGSQYQALGTGFWMTPDTVAPFRGILFTANHVLKEACDAGITIVQLRVEESSGVQKRLPLIICDKQIIQQNVVFVPKWTKHPTADIAAIIPPVSDPSQLLSQIIPLGLDQLPTAADLEKWHIAEGDDILALAFYPHIEGDQPSLAIVRQGIIADLRTQSGSFLVSVQAFPGNSGAPVLLKPTVVHLAFGEGPNEIGLANPPYLVGVITEYIPYQEAAVSPQTRRVRILFEENSGLARVVGFEMVRELLATMSPMLPKR